MRLVIESVFLFFFIVLLTPFSNSYAAPNEASMNEITEAVQKLCGGKGKRSEFSVKGGGTVGASKAVSLVVAGKVTGEATFSDEEWDGVRAVQFDSANYTACVQKLTPIFIEKFAGNDSALKQPDVKTLDTSLGIKSLRDYCTTNPGVPPPIELLNPPQQAACRNGSTDSLKPICLCP